MLHVLRDVIFNNDDFFSNKFCYFTVMLFVRFTQPPRSWASYVDQCFYLPHFGGGSHPKGPPTP